MTRLPLRRRYLMVVMRTEAQLLCSILVLPANRQPLRLVSLRHHQHLRKMVAPPAPPPSLLVHRQTLVPAQPASPSTLAARVPTEQQRAASTTPFPRQAATTLRRRLRLVPGLPFPLPLDLRLLE